MYVCMYIRYVCMDVSLYVCFLYVCMCVYIYMVPGEYDELAIPLTPSDLRLKLAAQILRS